MATAPNPPLKAEVETKPAFYHGRLSAIGATPLQLTARTGLPKLTRGIYVQAGAGNSTNKIYVGLGNTVTADAADTTDGYELAAGQSVLVPVDDPTQIWVVGSTTGLKAFWLGA